MNRFLTDGCYTKSSQMFSKFNGQQITNILCHNGGNRNNQETTTLFTKTKLDRTNIKACTSIYDIDDFENNKLNSKQFRESPVFSPFHLVHTVVFWAGIIPFSELDLVGVQYSVSLLSWGLPWKWKLLFHNFDTMGSKGFSAGNVTVFRTALF